MARSLKVRTFVRSTVVQDVKLEASKTFVLPLETTDLTVTITTPGGNPIANRGWVLFENGAPAQRDVHGNIGGGITGPNGKSTIPRAWAFFGFVTLDARAYNIDGSEIVSNPVGITI